MSTFKKVGDWHDLGHGHKFVLVESSYNDKVVGGVLSHNMLGTEQPCDPGLVQWEPVGPARPLFRVMSKPGEQLSLDPFIVCEICGDRGWIIDGKWEPKVDDVDDLAAISAVPLEGDEGMFTEQVRRDLGDVVPEEEENADRKLYALDGSGDVVPGSVPEEDFMALPGAPLPREMEPDPLQRAHDSFFAKRDEYFVDKDKAKISEIVSPDAEITTNEHGGSQSKIPVRFDLVDGPAMFRMAAVLHEGAEKYGANNWRAIPIEDHLNHLIMHAYAYLSGDTSDEHLSHIMCRAMFAQGVECQDGIQDRKDI